MQKKVVSVLIVMILTCSMNVGASTESETEENVNGLVTMQESISDCAIAEESGFQGESGKNISINNVSGNGNPVKVNGEPADQVNDEILTETVLPAPELVTDPLEESVSENLIAAQEKTNEEVDMEENNFKDLDLESVSANEKGQENGDGDEDKDNQKLNDKEILKVSMPAKVQAYFDPQNLSGKGEVYSEKYKVVNYGNRDIAIRIKKVNVSYSSDPSLYEFSQEPVENSLSDKKKININMVWDNEEETQKQILNVDEGHIEEYVICLKAAKYDKNGDFVKLDKDSVGIFYFTGSVNSNPDLEWQNGEIGLSFSYQVVSVEENISNKIADSLL